MPPAAGRDTAQAPPKLRYLRRVAGADRKRRPTRDTGGVAPSQSGERVLLITRAVILLSRAPLSVPMRIGFHASHEQWPPSTLLDFVRRADQAGFAAGMCSDHFHPWLETEGYSGFSWSWLGAALTATQLSFGTVCAPGQRYHPAIIAQAAATLAEMFPKRFWLAVGSGEALNEHITGNPWPAKDQRNARLKECVDVMRALWAGELVNHRGLVRVVDAKLYSRPVELPLVIGAALTPETARWMGKWADGLITAGRNSEDHRRIVNAFRDGGGDGKPLFLQNAISFAESDEAALREAHREWRHCALQGDQISDLRMPRDFDAATRNIAPQQVAERLRVSADIKRHIEWLREDMETGFDIVYVHQIGRNMGRFIDAFAAEVLPAFSGK
jgi:coenzyme F420-dependent glucose-6-phosphate dehydrogenase